MNPSGLDDICDGSWMNNKNSRFMIISEQMMMMDPVDVAIITTCIEE